MKLSLSGKQALHVAAEENAKTLWEKIKWSFTCQAEDRRIDFGSLLKKQNESANEYIARSRGISIKCQAFGLNTTERELVFYTVRGLKGNFSKVCDILKAQPDKGVEEVLEILRKEE